MVAWHHLTHVIHPFFHSFAHSHCYVQNQDYLLELMLQRLVSFLARLDAHDPFWAHAWKQRRETILAGHWIRRPGPESWNLPREIVGAIKDIALRADGPKAIQMMEEANAKGKK